MHKRWLAQLLDNKDTGVTNWVWKKQLLAWWAVPRLLGSQWEQTEGNREYNVHLTLDGWVTSRHISDRIGQQVIQLGSGMLYVNVTRYRFKRLVTFALSFFKPGIEFFIKDNFAFLYLVLSQVDYLGVFGRLVDWCVWQDISCFDEWIGHNRLTTKLMHWLLQPQRPIHTANSPVTCPFLIICKWNVWHARVYYVTNT